MCLHPICDGFVGANISSFAAEPAVANCDVRVAPAGVWLLCDVLRKADKEVLRSFLKSDNKVSVGFSPTPRKLLKKLDQNFYIIKLHGNSVEFLWFNGCFGFAVVLPSLLVIRCVPPPLFRKMI